MAVSSLADHRKRNIDHWEERTDLACAFRWAARLNMHEAVANHFSLAVNEDGTLTYSFVESLVASHPGFIVRLVGGGFFLTGMLLMSYNTWRTVRQARPEGILAAARMA